MICCVIAYAAAAAWVFAARRVLKKMNLYKEPPLEEEYLDSPESPGEGPEPV